MYCFKNRVPSYMDLFVSQLEEANKGNEETKLTFKGLQTVFILRLFKYSVEGLKEQCHKACVK
jgi:hypothetical protein